MVIAFTKLLDIAARSMFVLFVLYALPVRASGQFGLTLTIVGFFAFTAGFERYIDVQRRAAGQTAAETDHLIVSTVRFFLLNHAIGLPILLILLTQWVQLPAKQALLALVVAVGEHLSNEVYRFALMEKRHRWMLFGVLAKNVASLAAAVVTFLAFPGRFDLEVILSIWCAMSILAIVAVAAGFVKSRATPDDPAGRSAGLSQIQQYRASITHFATGLMSMAALQADRLIVGSLVSLEETGNFFRHVLLASFLYQVFNVLSYNRVATRVYDHVRSGRRQLGSRLISRELQWLVPIALLLAGAAWVADTSWLRALPATSGIEPRLLAILILGYLVRTVADYNALMLNATYREHDILVSQGICIASAAALNLIMTPRFGITGAVCVVPFSATVYLVLTATFARRSGHREVAL